MTATEATYADHRSIRVWPNFRSARKHFGSHYTDILEAIIRDVMINRLGTVTCMYCWGGSVWTRSLCAWSCYGSKFLTLWMYLDTFTGVSKPIVLNGWSSWCRYSGGIVINPTKRCNCGVDILQENSVYSLIIQPNFRNASEILLWVETYYRVPPAIPLESTFHTFVWFCFANISFALHLHYLQHVDERKHCSN